MNPPCNPYLLAALYCVLDHHAVAYLTVQDLDGPVCCDNLVTAHDEIRATTSAHVTLHAQDESVLGWIDIAGYETGQDWLLDHSTHPGMAELLAPALTL